MTNTEHIQQANYPHSRIVIAIEGGAGEVVKDLSHGPAETYIVDFDDLRRIDERERESVVFNRFPRSVALWVMKRLKPPIIEGIALNRQ